MPEFTDEETSICREAREQFYAKTGSEHDAMLFLKFLRSLAKDDLLKFANT